MANGVNDQFVFQVKADITQFTSQIKRVQDQLNGLANQKTPASKGNPAYDQAAAELKRLDTIQRQNIRTLNTHTAAMKATRKAADELSGGQAKTGDSAEKSGAALMKGAAKLFIYYQAIKQVANFLKVGVDFNAIVESNETALTVMLRSAEKAKGLMGDLFKLQATTNIGVAEGAEGSKQLMAYGFELKDVVSTLKTMRTIAGAVNVPLNDMVYVYGTLRSQGRAYTRDIMQFAMRGIPIYEELATVLETDVSQVKKLVEEGKVGFKEVEQAMKNMTTGGGIFAGMLEKSMDTLTGKFQLLGKNVQLVMGAMMKPSEGPLKKFADDMSKLVLDLGPSFSQMGQGLSEVIKLLADTLVDVTAKLVPIISELVGAVGVIVSAAAPLVQTLIDATGIGFVADKVKEYRDGKKAEYAFNPENKVNDDIAMGKFKEGLTTALAFIVNPLAGIANMYKNGERIVDGSRTNIRSEQQQKMDAIGGNPFQYMIDKAKELDIPLQSAANAMVRAGLMSQQMADRFVGAATDADKAAIVWKKFFSYMGGGPKAGGLPEKEAPGWTKVFEMFNMRASKAYEGTKFLNEQSGMGRIGPTPSASRLEELLKQYSSPKEGRADADQLFSSYREALPADTTKAFKSLRAFPKDELDKLVDQFNDKMREKIIGDIQALSDEMQKNPAMNQENIEGLRQRMGALLSEYADSKNGRKKKDGGPGTWWTPQDIATRNTVDNPYDDIMLENAKALESLGKEYYEQVKAAKGNKESIGFLTLAYDNAREGLRTYSSILMEITALQKDQNRLTTGADFKALEAKSISDLIDINKMRYEAEMAGIEIARKTAGADFALLSLKEDMAKRQRDLNDEAVRTNAFKSFGSGTAWNDSQDKAGGESISSAIDFFKSAVQADAMGLGGASTLLREAAYQQMAAANANKFGQRMLAGSEIGTMQNTAQGLTDQGVGAGDAAGAAVGESFLTALAQFALSFESINELLNPFKTILGQLNEFLGPIIESTFKPLADILKDIGDILGGVLAPVFNIIGIVTRTIAFALKFLLIPIQMVGNALAWLNDNVIVPVGNMFIDIMNGIIDAINFLFGWAGVHIRRLDRLLTTAESRDLEKQIETAGNVFDATMKYITDKMKKESDKMITSARDLYEAGAITAADYEKKVREATQYMPPELTGLENVMQGAIDAVSLEQLKVQYEYMKANEEAIRNTQIGLSTANAHLLRIANNTELLGGYFGAGAGSTSAGGGVGGGVTGAGTTDMSSLELALRATGLSSTALGIAGKSMKDAITTLGMMLSPVFAIPQEKKMAAAKMLEALGPLYAQNQDATIPSFAVGSYNIPQDTMANVHKGEMIISEPIADSIRNNKLALSGGSGYNGGNQTNVYVTVQGSVTTENELTDAIAKSMYRRQRSGVLTYAN